MRKLLIIMFAGLLVTVACTSKKTEYPSADGKTKAVYDELNGSWLITDSTGAEPVQDYDSMRVTEVGKDGHPMTVIYYKGNRQTQLQYYTGMIPRSRGEIVDSRREGPWVFYYPDGKVQAEATFVGGREEGSYRVYRENGVPFYIGQYRNGARVGLWEVYDEEGNMVETKSYD